MTPFSDIYRRHARDVFRFAFWLARDEEEAKDVTAETFARAWAGADDLRVETVKAYLFAIARNLVRENHRKRRPETEVDEAMPDARPDPEARAAARGDLARVRRAVDALPEVDRAALLMRVTDGTSYADVARALGISVAAAKVKVHRARLRLAEAKEGTHERQHHS
ncbi:MAG TPA: sigma-70 family RNA polymerase sigma factor [Thermoanaerobaculia bacterium]